MCMYMYIRVHVERLPSTQNVAGSSPTRGSSSFSLGKKGELSSGVVALLCLVSMNDCPCDYSVALVV